MRIVSARTRRDIETAALLRFAGATWETVAQQLGRLKCVAVRWPRDYPEAWARAFDNAQKYWACDDKAKARAAIRLLLRHESAEIRSATADKLVRQWLASRARAALPDPRTDLDGFLARFDELSDDDRERYLSELVVGDK